MFYSPCQKETRQRADYRYDGIIVEHLFEGRDESDFHRRGLPIPYLTQMLSTSVVLCREADTIRDFNRNLAPLFLEPWARDGIVMEEFAENAAPSETALPGQNVKNVYVDYMLKSGHNYWDNIIILGEFKRHGIINYTRWTTGPMSDSERDLGRELRGLVRDTDYLPTMPNLCFRYAHRYRVPHIFCWDGWMLLLVRFQAAGPQDIISCQADTVLIPRESMAGCCTVQHGVYVLIREARHRLVGEKSAAIQAYIFADNIMWRREFRWYDGKPIWVGAGLFGTLTVDVPTGWFRRFRADQQYWVWEYPQTGAYIRDTVNVKTLRLD
jgi:hypothetical protein